ncbi:hypothetical protein Q8F55_006998 [Vanrija albida]|uniref:RRM domain-containing protein n=1 Tax=Vanrija albida TaxID=181172 RepID=A0ABR3PYK0_9TREE
MSQNQQQMYQASDGKWYPVSAMPQNFAAQQQPPSYGYGQQPPMQYGQQQPQQIYVQQQRPSGGGAGAGAAGAVGCLAACYEVYDAHRLPVAGYVCGRGYASRVVVNVEASFNVTLGGIFEGPKQEQYSLAHLLSKCGEITTRVLKCSVGFSSVEGAERALGLDGFKNDLCSLKISPRFYPDPNELIRVPAGTRFRLNKYRWEAMRVLYGVREEKGGVQPVDTSLRRVSVCKVEAFTPAQMRRIPPRVYRARAANELRANPSHWRNAVLDSVNMPSMDGVYDDYVDGVERGAWGTMVEVRALARNQGTPILVLGPTGAELFLPSGYRRRFHLGGEDAPHIVLVHDGGTLFEATASHPFPSHCP